MRVHCVRTSVPARPPVTLPVPSRLHRPLISPLKTKDWTSLWPCGIVHAPLSSLFSFFFFFFCLCGPLSSLSPQSRVEQSIIKIVTGSGSGIVRKPTPIGDMLNSFCEEKTKQKRGECVRELLMLSHIPSLVIHANKPHQQHWHQCYWHFHRAG